MKRLFDTNWKDFLLILLGAGILAAGIAWFADPLGLVTGGVTGAAIVVSKLSQLLFGFAISLGLLNILLNVPIFIISGVQQGFLFVRKSLLGMLMLSVWLWVFQAIPNPLDVGDDLLLGTLLSGVLMGVGLAFVLRTGATTGGTDMLAISLHRIFPHIPLSAFLFIIDGLVIVAGLFVFGVRITMYALVSVFISTRLIDSMLGGMKFAKAVFILSPKNDDISDAIFREIGHSNTGIHARGMYSRKESEMLFVVVWPKELPLLKSIVQNIDPDAFVTICPAQEVMGDMQAASVAMKKAREKKHHKHETASDSTQEPSD